MHPDQQPLLLGVDGGTESIRVGVFTASGTQIAAARYPYPTRHEHPGWAEQDPDDWWHAFTIATRKALAEAGVKPSRIRGIALACTCFTVVCVGADDRPLRPAMLWMDVRSTREAAEVAEADSESLRYSGRTHASAEWMLPKALWLRRHEPATYAATAWLADFVEWMTFRLTADRAASVDSAAIRAYYDRLLGGWPLDLWSRVGIDDLVDRVPERVALMGEQVGALSTTAAAELGLPPGTPVAAGGADAFVALLGLGVTGPGTLGLVTGSSHVHMLQTTEPVYSSDLFGSYTDAVIPGQYTLEGGQTSTGSTVTWLIRMLLGEASSPDARARALDRLNREAAELPAGSDGLLALDYWQGNRTPHVDNRARGMLWGLSLSHGPQHVFRAILESICFGTESIVRAMRRTGAPIDSLVACGGALNSPLWLQLHADVSGIPIRTTTTPDAAMLGAAVLAAAGAGVHADVGSAAAAMAGTSRVIEPDERATEAYRPVFELYLESYAAMRPLLHRAAGLAERAGLVPLAPAPAPAR